MESGVLMLIVFLLLSAGRGVATARYEVMHYHACLNHHEGLDLSGARSSPAETIEVSMYRAEL